MPETPLQTKLGFVRSSLLLASLITIKFTELSKCNICVCFLTKTSCFKIPILSERYHWIVFGYAQVCLATVTQPGGLINKNLSESTCAIRLSSGAGLFRSEVVLMTSNSCKYLFEVIS